MSLANGVERPFQHLSILLVEDEPFVQNLIGRVLRALGVPDVTVASNGHEALKILDLPNLRGFDLKFDLIISDWNMPEMTGLELLKKVRATRPHMPFIMLTGNTSGDHVIAAKDHGVNGYIGKPITPVQLSTKIAAVLKIKLR
jgi:two-component system chemotaxis response regulator CheY